ncbi:uncharacterized protein LOC144452793 [Glandiceps talaboti]
MTDNTEETRLEKAKKLSGDGDNEGALLNADDKPNTLPASSADDKEGNSEDAKNDYATAKIRIESKLEALRRDLTIMQSQDQSLLRQLLRIHEMIGQLTGQRKQKMTIAAQLKGGSSEVQIQDIIDRLSPRRLPSRSLSFSATDLNDLTPEFDFDEDFDKLSCSYPAPYC